MKQHQQRVVTEKKELDIKLEALVKFIEESLVFAGLPAPEQERLVRQRWFMNGYSNVLGERIAEFETE